MGNTPHTQITIYIFNLGWSIGSLLTIHINFQVQCNFKEEQKTHQPTDIEKTTLCSASQPKIWMIALEAYGLVYYEHMVWPRHDHSLTTGIVDGVRLDQNRRDLGGRKWIINTFQEHSNAETCSARSFLPLCHGIVAVKTEMAISSPNIALADGNGESHDRPIVEFKCIQNKKALWSLSFKFHHQGKNAPNTWFLKVPTRDFWKNVISRRTQQLMKKLKKDTSNDVICSRTQ